MSKIIAFEFSDHSIKFIEGRRKGKILRIFRKAEIDLPYGILSDGIPKDFHEVSEVLKKILGNSAKHKKAVFLINSNTVFIRKLELPYVKNSKETRSMIKFKLQEMQPSYINQYKIMYKISEVFMCEGVKKARYTVYGMPLKMYEGYMEISERLKLDLAAMDISSNFTNYILNENINGHVKKDIVAVIYAGKSNMCLSIAYNGITELFRITEYDHEDTLLLKCFDEIRKYMKYYTSLSKDNIIEKIYLIGDSLSYEFKEDLSDLGIEVEVIREMPCVLEHGPEIKDEFYDYFNLTASFYLDENHIDFLTEKKEKMKYRFAVGVAVMSAILITALGFSYNFLNYYFKTSMLKNEVYSKKVFLSNDDNILLNNEIENMKKKTVFLENYVVMAGEAKKKTILDNLISSNLFEKIKDCAANGTKIKSFYADANNVEINCESISLKSVALFVENLRKIEFVDNVKMTNVEVKKEGEVSKFTYAVTCYLKGVDYEEQ